MSRNRFCDFLADHDAEVSAVLGRLLCKSQYSITKAGSGRTYVGGVEKTVAHGVTAHTGTTPAVHCGLPRRGAPRGESTHILVHARTHTSIRAYTFITHRERRGGTDPVLDFSHHRRTRGALAGVRVASASALHVRGSVTNTAVCPRDLGGARY